MKTAISLVLISVLGFSIEVTNADSTFGTPTNIGPTVNSSALDVHPVYLLTVCRFSYVLIGQAG